MDWTLYITETRPNPLAEVLDLMRIGNEHIVQLLLAAIMGLVSLGVSNIKDLTDKMQNIAVVLHETRAENRIQFGQHSVSLQDHEQRLRFMELKNKK